MLPLLADTLLLFIAASLAKPIQPVLDAYAARTGTVIQRESGASLEHARKITELHRIPDLLLLADVEVISQLLVPKYATWYAEFARNRMVVAYTDRSKRAREITPTTGRRSSRATTSRSAEPIRISRRSDIARCSCSISPSATTNSRASQRRCSARARTQHSAERRRACRAARRRRAGLHLRLPVGRRVERIPFHRAA